MKIHIRNAKSGEQAVNERTFFVAEYDGIELQVNAKNKAAYKIYSDYGFTNKSINMELL